LRTHWCQFLLWHKQKLPLSPLITRWKGLTKSQQFQILCWNSRFTLQNQLEYLPKLYALLTTHWRQFLLYFWHKQKISLSPVITRWKDQHKNPSLKLFEFFRLCFFLQWKLFFWFDISRLEFKRDQEGVQCTAVNFNIFYDANKK